jgi:hypothetical protein
MRKWPEMPAKSPRRITSTVKRIIRRSRRARRALWIMVRNLDEARADEAEEERRKADFPFGLVPLSSSSS